MNIYIYINLNHKITEWNNCHFISGGCFNCNHSTWLFVFLFIINDKMQFWQSEKPLLTFYQRPFFCVILNPRLVVIFVANNEWKYNLDASILVCFTSAEAKKKKNTTNQSSHPRVLLIQFNKLQNKKISHWNRSSQSMAMRILMSDRKANPQHNQILATLPQKIIFCYTAKNGKPLTC